MKNGELLAVADQAGFDLFLTTDQNMGYQQNLAGRTIAIVVLDLQQWPKLKSHIAEVIEAVDAATPGSYLKLKTNPL